MGTFGLEHHFRLQATMRWVSFLLVISPAVVFGEMYNEGRKVTDSKGKMFYCEYSLFYNKPDKFIKTKSSASCTPNKTSRNVVTTTLDIEDMNVNATVTLVIQRGRGTISKMVVEDKSDVAAPAPAQEETQDCTCKMNQDKIEELRLRIEKMENQQGGRV